MKILLRNFLIVLSVIITIFNIFIIILNINTYLHRNDWKERTTPLPVTTIRNLCINFNIENDNPLCDGKKNIYNRDFFETIIDSLRPYWHKQDKVGTATFVVVEEKLGEYKIECESIITEGDGFSYYTCSYDLRGDGSYILYIWFTYPDNFVYRINTPMGED
jgi:hypothetical protein